MTRVSLFLVYFVSVEPYAIEDWYVASCGLIALVTVVEHPDMPKMPVSDGACGPPGSTLRAFGEDSVGLSPFGD